MKGISFIVLTLFMSCSSQNLSEYENENPKLKIKEFFNGNVEALGIVQNRQGSVVSRFKVDIRASWSEEVGTLDETFYYSDKTTSKRIWKLTENIDGSFSGAAGDVIGKAKGNVSGNSFLFEYVLQVPLNGSVYNINVEDWMYLLDNGTLLGRSYMTKFGFNVGEITLIMTNKSLK